MIFLILFLLFQTNQFDEYPSFGVLEYPEPEIKEGVNEIIYGILKIKMDIDADGLISSVQLLESENIPKEKIDYYFNFFKKQLEGRIGTPAKKNGKPISCTYIHFFSFLLYYFPKVTYVEATQTKEEEIENIKEERKDLMERRIVPIEFISGEKITKILTPDGRVVPIEDFKKELHIKAKELLQKDKLREIRKGSVIYITDSSSKLDDEFYINALVVIHRYFYEFFKPLIDKDPFLPFHYAYIFENKNSYEEFKKIMGTPKWADGNYLGNIMILSSCTCFENPLLIRETLIHEEVHYLVEQILFKGIQIPKWINEGISEFFAQSYIDSGGKMHLGKLNTKIYRHKISGKIYLSRANFYRDLILNMEKNEREKIIERIFQGSFDIKKESSEKDIENFYTFSWAFFNFISKDKNKVIDFLREIKNGKKYEQILAEFYGSSEKVKKEFLKFVKKL